MQIEIAIVGRHLHDLLQLDQLFALAAIRDQALDRANAQPVFVVKFHQLRQSRHRPVVVQDLAEHARGLQSRHSCQVDRGFGVTGAPQHAAVFGAQGKNVTGLVQIFGR